MSYYLFLDDSRKPCQVNWVTLPENVAWVSARTYSDFVYVISQMGIPKFVAYDCDLEQEHYDAYFKHREGYLTVYPSFQRKCGIDCITHLLKLCKKAGVKHPDYIIHTQNHYAQGYMEKLISEFNAHVSSDAPSNNDWNKQHIVPDYAIHDAGSIAGFFGPYRFLSNFWPAAVEWRGVDFPSVEVAYQAAKFQDVKELETFVSLTATEAKKKGKTAPIDIDFWNARKVDIMRYLVLQKFSKHSSLRNQLVATADRHLVEANAWKDTFWGVYYRFNQATRLWENKGGENTLGKILMKVRNLVQ